MPSLFADNTNARSANGTFPPGHELREAARHLSYAVGSECPECGSTSTEDNGGTEYRCVACDHRWGTEGGERYGF